MPTFSRVVLETLLDQGVGDSYTSYLNSKQQKIFRPVVVDVSGNGEGRDSNCEIHLHISCSVCDSAADSDPSSPSPYIVNHKKRGGNALSRRSEGYDQCAQLKSVHDDNIFENADLAVDVLEESLDNEYPWPEVIVSERNAACCEQVSNASCIEVDDYGKQADSQSYLSNHGEFFDAIEELSSTDESTPNIFYYVPKLESELHATRLSILQAIEKRKKAEFDLGRLQSQWQRLSALVYESGLSFPPLKDASGLQLNVDPLNQFCQEIVVARFVSEAMGKDMARFKAEVAAEDIIESKDPEINRLRDRVHYYEAEPLQLLKDIRFLIFPEEARKQRLEVARKQWLKRTGRRYGWGFLGLCTMVASCVIGYSYHQQTLSLPGSSSNSSSNAYCNS